MYFPAGSKLGGDGADDDSMVVIPALVANHLRALAEALLRNEERRTLNAYVDVRSLSPFQPIIPETGHVVVRQWTCCRQCDNFSLMSHGFFIRRNVLIEVMLVRQPLYRRAAAWDFDICVELYSLGSVGPQQLSPASTSGDHPTHHTWIWFVQ